MNPRANHRANHRANRQSEPQSELKSAPSRSLDELYETIGELRETRERASLHRAASLRPCRRIDHASFARSAAAKTTRSRTLRRMFKYSRRSSHRGIPRVIEGFWVGKDSFAVVSERVQGSTLHEMLSAGERPTNPRIAMVLQDVNQVLVWAREHGIVHRGVTPDSLYFERETHAPRMSLALTAIPIEGVPDARSDARTIGRLAWAMLMGHAVSDDVHRVAPRRCDAIWHSASSTKRARWSRGERAATVLTSSDSSR